MFGLKKKEPAPPSARFDHDPVCGTPDAAPEWVDEWFDNERTGRFTRTCSCRVEYWQPPVEGSGWRPDLKAFQHTGDCPIAGMSSESMARYMRVDDIGDLPGLAFKVHCVCRPDSWEHWYAPEVAALPARTVEF